MYLRTMVKMYSQRYHDTHKSTLNMRAQRKGILISFNWLNDAIIQNDDTEADVDSSSPVDTISSRGIHMFRRQIEAAGRPISESSDRAAYIQWLCEYSPIMTRALELPWKNVHGQERILVYMDDAWLQW